MSSPRRPRTMIDVVTMVAVPHHLDADDTLKDT
jgi:hypothetical protein